MFKRFDDHQFDSQPDRQLARDGELAEITRPVLLCGRCDAEITTPDDRIERHGGHVHDCTNPVGITFRIGCFEQANGCAEVGASSAEHSWFPGYRWRVSVCGRCTQHLGWLFEGDGEGFYGLILAHLRDGG